MQLKIHSKIINFETCSCECMKKLQNIIVPQKEERQVIHNIKGFAMNGGTWSMHHSLKNPNIIPSEVIVLHPRQKPEMESITDIKYCHILLLYGAKIIHLADMSADT